MSKVLLGMSGGVDSSVSALLLKKSGYDVTGITFIMTDDMSPSCGSESAASEAEKNAREIGIGHITLDVRSLFEKNVINDFLDVYTSGGTPNPCVRCNKTMKFPQMLKYADENGFDYIATGHYASVECRKDGFHLLTAYDSTKDQTYFLYTLDQNILKRTIFPLSGIRKEKVREIAFEAGLSSSEKKDSQDICFIPGGDYKKFAVSRSETLPPIGHFINTDGKIIGNHKGIFGYTPGQRRGLGISSTQPLYVKEIIPSKNHVVLCTENELYRSSVSITDASFILGKCPNSAFRADVKTRYTKRSSPALITPIGENEYRIDFDLPERAPARGQSAVFYLENELLGGGIII